MSRCYLHRAAASGNNGRIKKLLHQGADVNAEDEQGLTPLMYAVVHRNTEIVRLLLESGADGNAGRWRLGSGKPLSTAAQDGCTEIVKLLLTAGSDIKKGGFLARAAGRGHTKIVRLLLDKGADINDEAPVAEAAYGGHTGIVKLLLDNGADMNDKAPIAGAAYGGLSAPTQRLKRCGRCRTAFAYRFGRGGPSIRHRTVRQHGSPAEGQ